MQNLFMAGRVKSRVLLSAVVACMLLALAAASASAASLATLRIAYNPNATNTSIVVAEQQGFFTQNGINAELTPAADTTGLLPSLGKQFDLIGSGPAGILQFAQGGYHPVLVDAQTIENGTNLRNTYLMANKGVTSLAQLAGKTVGAAALDGTQYSALLWTLKHDGLNPNSVHILQVPFGSMANDLASGTIQAALAINPFAATMASAGYVDLGDPIETALHGETAMSIGWVANKSWVPAHKKLLAEFTKAENEALAWMNANPAGAQAVLVNSFQLSTVAASKYPITAYVSFKPKAVYLSAWVTPMKVIGALKKSYHPNISQLIYNP